MLSLCLGQDTGSPEPSPRFDSVLPGSEAYGIELIC